MRPTRLAVIVAALLAAWTAPASADPIPAAASELTIAWLGMRPADPPEPAFIDRPAPTDEGLAGLRLAVSDDNASGRFMHQSFGLEAEWLPPGGDAAAALRRLAAAGVRFVVADLPAAVLAKAAADPAAAAVTIFNAGAPDDVLRNRDCRANVLHTLPSRAMLADALAQYLVKKTWTRWLLVTGPTAGDQAYAAAIRHAAAKFGARLVGEKSWTYTRDSRHTATGEVAALTQDGDYDVVVVADEAGDFGDLVPYDTWLPRPVAGTQGLVSAAWHPAYSAWAAAQLQERFRGQAHRAMTAKDYAAWEGGRAVGEAAMRLRSTDPVSIARAIRSDDFALPAYKGRTLSFRSWDGQLRQPILIAWARNVVSVAPEDGFLHPVTDLDTLGTDKGESKCVLH